MEDSSVNSNGNLLPYQYYGNKPNRHLSAKFTIITTNGSVDYDKELLKWTMLEHEATFRKQVYELHHLYKTQKHLMAQFQREESNSYPSNEDTSQPVSYLSQSSSDNVKRIWQAEHDKQSSVHLMHLTKGTDSQYSANGAPLKHKNVRSSKKMLDLQLPAHVYAAATDDDDELEILDEKPSKSMPWISGSVLGGNVKLNLGSSGVCSHVEGSWITDIKPPHSSVMHMLNKPVEESSYIEATDFCGVGISTAQNQHYLSGGVNSNDQCAGKLSGANEEILHSSFGNKMDEPSTSMAWSKYKQNGIESSMGHYMVSPLSFNNLILARPGFNDELNPPWQSNDTSYMSRSNYDPVETSIAKNVLFSGISMDSAPNKPHHHSLKIHEVLHHQKHPLLHGFMKDIDLNDAPPDTTQDGANTIADTNKRNCIDLNEALPFMDDAEMDDHEPGGNIAPNETDDPLRDSLAVTAAEDLLVMCNHVFQPESPQSNTLHWFADLATLKENTMLDSDDDFEALTLKLQETKSFEYNSTSRIQEDNNNDGHCSAASLFLTRSRRGGRNGQRPRGRRRRRSVAVTLEEAEVSLPLVPADLDADALGITRWGRTTRRCRKPRCPPASNVSLRVA